MRVKVEFIKDGILTIDKENYKVNDNIVDVPEAIALRLKGMVGYTLLDSFSPTTEKTEIDIAPPVETKRRPKR